MAKNRSKSKNSRQPSTPQPTQFGDGVKQPLTQSAIAAAMAPGGANQPGPMGTQGWFSPLQPVTPVVPASMADSVRGRQLDFRAGQNLQIRPRSEEAVSFEMMRNLADSCDVLRLVIETRKDQMAGQTFSIVPIDESQKPDARCKEVEDFFKLPNGEDDYVSWQRQVLEDMFVLDAVAVYPWLTNDGSPYRFDLIDPATIKRVINDQGRTPQPHEGPAYQQILKGVPVSNYTTDELVYAIRNKRTHKLYGYSPVEQIIVTVNTAIRRTMHQLQFYTEGSTPDLLMSCPPDWNMDMVRDFNEWWTSMLSGNTAQRRQGVFIPAGVAPVNTKDGALTDKYDEWLARIVCYAFSVSSAPFVAQMNRATAESAADAALMEGLHPVMLWQASFVNFLIWKFFGYTDLHMKWDDTKVIDPQVQSAIDDQCVRNGTKTINQIRQARGDEAVDGGDKPLVYLPTGPVELAAVVKANTDLVTNPPPPPPMLAPGGAAGAPKPGEPGQGSGAVPPKPAAPAPAPAAPAPAPAAKMAKADAKKALAGVSRIDRERPAVQALQRVLQRKVANGLKKAKTKAVAALVARYGHEPKRIVGAGVEKRARPAAVPHGHGMRCRCNSFVLAKAADPSDVDKATVDAILQALDLGDMSDMTDDVAALLEQVMRDSGAQAFAQLGLEVDTDLVNQNAVDYASERAAELVSQVSESTREMLRSDVEDALDEGWSNDKLAGVLEDNYGFSSDRADTIATTETAIADVQGNLEAYRGSGVVEGKQWVVGDDCCDVCGDMDGTTIGLDEEFEFDGDNVDGPPGHPRCRCDILPVLSADTGEDGGDTTDASDDNTDDGDTVEAAARGGYVGAAGEHHLAQLHQSVALVSKAQAERIRATVPAGPARTHTFDAAAITRDTIAKLLADAPELRAMVLNS